MLGNQTVLRVYVPEDSLITLRTSQVKFFPDTPAASPRLDPDFPRRMFGAVEDGQEAVRFFSALKSQVMRELPADSLLVWQVKEGWG